MASETEALADLAGKLDSEDVKTILPGVAAFLESQYDLQIQIADLEADKLFAHRTGDYDRAAVLQVRIDALRAALERKKESSAQQEKWLWVIALVVFFVLMVLAYSATRGDRR